ncbi:MAG TPA: hypothetical protein VKF41_04770 [Bryobacteraceae bacterium]|nr:hypothetical protein [Bryobacteraceae bacterium]
MRKLTTKLTIAATILVAAASAASAQNMTARIPFEFRVGNRVMPAGTYQVGLANSTSGAPLFLIRGNYSLQSAILVAQARKDPRKAWAAEGGGKLEFACAGGVCALAELWDGSRGPAYKFRVPDLGKDDIHLAVIPLQRDKGE